MGASAVKIVQTFWELMGTNDFRSVGSVLTDDFVLDWPQSGERIRGRENYAAMNEQYPAQGRWTFTINRIVGDDDQAVSDVFVTDGFQKARAISFFIVREGKISRMVEFWPEPFLARDNRSHLVENSTRALKGNVD
jgi:ketosteroid isomerase-like protein